HMKEKNIQNPLQMLSSILNNANVRWALLFMFLLMTAGFSLIPYISDYMVNNVGISKDDLKYIYLLGGLATVVSGPIVGRMADKFGKQRLFIIMATLSIIPVIWITYLENFSQAIAFSVSTLFFILFGGRFVPAMAIITASVEAKDRGKFMSISSCTQQLSSSFAAFISGIIIINNASGAMTNFYVIGFIASTATLLCIPVSFKIKQVS